MTRTKRINPNRAFTTTKNGVKRIVLSAPLSPEITPQAKPLRTPSHPKHCFLTITHSDKGMLDDHAQQSIATAAILADDATCVIALVLGELHDDVTHLGVDKLIVIPEFDYQTFQPDVELACVLNIINTAKPTRIFMPDNSIGDGELGRRIIANMPEKSAATQVVEINRDHIGHKENQHLNLTALPNIILLAPQTTDPELPFIAAAIPEVATSISNIENSPYRNLGLLPTSTATIALEEADFIVAAGNGVNHVATLQTLAQSLDAAVGASRVAVDEGKFKREQQIGASGKTVSASAYLAIGISGAVQHLQGIKDCRHVIAINRDNSAPIIKRANLSVIGDAEEIMQALIKEVAEAKMIAKESETL